MERSSPPRRDVDRAAAESAPIWLGLAESTGGECTSRRTAQHNQTGSRWWLVLAVALCLAPTVATAQADKEEAPANSHAKRYGGGWECDRGYRNVHQSCEAVQVPANAHLDYFGDRWQCNRGYREIDGDPRRGHELGQDEEIRLRYAFKELDDAGKGEDA